MGLEREARGMAAAKRGVVEAGCVCGFQSEKELPAPRLPNAQGAWHTSVCDLLEADWLMRAG